MNFFSSIDFGYLIQNYLFEISFFIWFFSLVYILFFNKGNIKSRLLVAVGIGIVTTSCAVFPLVEEESLRNKWIYSIFFALNSITFNENISIIEKIRTSSLYEIFHFTGIIAMIFMNPLLTASVLLSFMNDVFVGIVLGHSVRKEIHIFSELNDKNKIIIQSLRKNNRSA